MQWLHFDFCPDVVPQSLGEGRTAVGGRGREGKGGTEGGHEHI